MSEGARLRDVFARSHRMVGRRIADEYVLVPLVGHGAELDSIYTLNAVGAFIWELLDGLRDGRQIVTAVVDRFAVERPEAEADYRAFLAKLVGIGAAFRAG